MEDDADVEKQNRVLLRPWLENMLENRSIPGLEWFDEEKTMFKVPWKHRSKKDWSMRHSSVFLEWAKNTGRWSEGDPAPNFAQLKTRLRCAFNKAPDIDEMKEHHFSKGEEPFKVYRFNTPRGEVKSVFGRKTCQKTAGKQGHWSRSPLVMKYESCEEEVIEDDYALYEDMDVNSTVPASKTNMLGVGQPMEEYFQRNLVYTQSGDNLMHANALFSTAGWAFGHDGGIADSQNDLRDSKSPIIPLTVEMMMSANGDSDCDADSPKKSWHHRVESGSGPVGNGVKAIKREGLSGKIHEAETRGNSSPAADGSTDRMHLLQMASLFVEAAERQKQEDTVVEEMPAEQGASMESAENFMPAKHYVIIMPSSYGKEVENMEQTNEGNATSGYVTPTGTEAIDLTLQTEDSNVTSLSKDNVTHLLELKVKSKIKSRDSTESGPPKQTICESEAVDLTKPAALMKCIEIREHRTSSADNISDDVKVHQPAAGLESKGSRDSEARRNYAVLTSSFAEEDPYASVDELQTCEYTTFEQMSHLGEEPLALKERRLYEWEKRLQSWEMQLQAKEETLYWRDRCLQSELGTKAASYHISNETVAWNKDPPSQGHIASPSGVVGSLSYARFRPATPCTTPNQPTINIPAAAPNRPRSVATRLVATHNLPVVTPNRPGSTPNPPVASPKLPSASPQLETSAPFTGGSELKQRLQQMIIKSHRLPALRAEGGNPAAPKSVDAAQTPVPPSTTLPSSVTGGAVVSSQPFVGLSTAPTAEPFSVSAGGQQPPIPLMSLIRPNSKGMPMIVPVLGGSQQMLLLPRYLVPAAMAMQAQAAQLETRDVLRGRSEMMREGRVTAEWHERDCRKLDKNSLLGTETNVETNVRNPAVVAISPSKRDEISSKAEIVMPVSIQERRESPQRKGSATPNSRCISQTGLTSDSDAEDRNNVQEFMEFLPGTDSVNGVKCGDVEITKESAATSNNIMCSRNVSGKSTASDRCEKISAENLSVSSSVSGNEGIGLTGSCRKDVKLPESVQKELAGHGSLQDFTKWLRAKTETICKEESEEGRKSVELCGQVQLCSDSSSNKEKCEHLNSVSIPQFASIKTVNSRSSDVAPCSDSLVSKQGSQLSVSPVSSPNVPLVVEHENDFLEKEGEDDEQTFSSNESPSRNGKRTNFGGQRRRSCEKQSAFKKARVDC